MDTAHAIMEEALERKLEKGQEMNTNKKALFLVPAIPVGLIGGILAISGLGYWDTFGFTYSMFVFIYIIAYTQGSRDCRAFIEANNEKKPDYAAWNEMQKLDAIQDVLLQCKLQKESGADIIQENGSHEENSSPKNESNTDVI